MKNLLLNTGKGKLTYTLSAVAIVWAVVGLFAGWLEVREALEFIGAGLVIFGIRRAQG